MSACVVSRAKPGHGRFYLVCRLKLKNNASFIHAKLTGVPTKAT